jgi:TRAP transporter TAXI family solute receptor
MTSWRILPAVAACALALGLVYGAYKSLTSTQTVHIASGAQGGGYYELGQKLEQILRADFEQQILEAPITFQHVVSHGPQENLRLLAHREAQLGLALEGLSVTPKEAGSADIRGLIKLSSSNLHIVVGPRLSQQMGKPITKFSDLVDNVRQRLGRPLRVYIGSPHGSTHAVVNLILNYYKSSTGTDLGWEVIEVGSYTEAAEAFLHDRLDMVCLLVATGSPAVLTMSQHGVLVPLPEALVDAIHMLRPALSAQTIPAGVYNKDFPRAAIATLGAEDILIANGEVSNRLAYRIVRTLALHWPELQAGGLLPEDFAKAQLSQNDYFPLHPGAVAYYKGENVPLWPWFENKIAILIEHRDIALSVLGGIPTVYTLFYAWYQRRRVTHLMAQIAAMRQQGAIDQATIENIRMHAITLMAQGKLSRESYASLNEFIEAQFRHASMKADQPPKKEVNQSSST